MSVTLETIIAKFRARHRCKDCGRGFRIPDRTRCQGCYNEYAALVSRRRRGGSNAPYRARVADSEGCNCGNTACNGLQCDRVSA